jgi:hypothetical protein
MRSFGLGKGYNDFKSYMAWFWFYIYLFNRKKYPYHWRVTLSTENGNYVNTLLIPPVILQCVNAALFATADTMSAIINTSIIFHGLTAAHILAVYNCNTIVQLNRQEGIKTIAKMVAMEMVKKRFHKATNKLTEDLRKRSGMSRLKWYLEHRRLKKLSPEEMEEMITSQLKEINELKALKAKKEGMTNDNSANSSNG